MRVLIVHNRYRSSIVSGENRSVDTEVAVLRGAGVEVETFFRSSDEIESYGLRQWTSLAIRPVYSRADVEAFRGRLAAFRPHVVHLHNVFPLISPWVVRVAKAAGVPVVQSVHNYRHACMSGDLFRNGRICQDCRGTRIPWPGVVHGCYRGSRWQSATMAAALTVHRPTWRLVDRFLVISDFVGRYLEAEGIPRDRISLVPSFVADPGAPSPPGSGIVFAGRLDEEKGVRLLLEAWARLEPGAAGQLVIAGDGPERSAVEAAAERLPGLFYVGRVTGERVAQLMTDAAVIVMPSVWYEPMGRTVIEAFARGRPVVATAIGAPGDLVDDSVGWNVSPNAASLAAVLSATADKNVVRRKGEAAWRRYKAEFAPDRVLRRLVAAYEAVQLGRDRSPL